jgi:hypothetical protein
MKKTRVASSKMRRVCPMWALSKRLPHDPEDNADGQGTHHGRHRSVRDIGDSVGDVRVADVLEEERSIVANQPAGECKEEFAKGRVDIEEVGSLKVV